MEHAMTRSTFAAQFLLLAPLAAQKMPLPDGSQRVVALVDVGDLLGERAGEGGGGAAPAALLRRLAGFVRAFAAPPLADGTDLQPLGDRHLAVLGAPEQAAAVEKFVASARKARDRQCFLDFKLVEVPEAFFTKELSGKLTVVAGAGEPAKAPRVAVLATDEDVAALLGAIRAEQGATILQAPKIVAGALQNATIQVGNNIAYVRDFEIEVAEAAFIADPVVDTIWDGVQIEAICGPLADGTIGVQFEVLAQKVERPLPQFETTLPGTTQKVAIQVPRASGCKGSQTVALRDGATAVMAARKNSGTWLVTLLTVSGVK
jgi:hypothetical protein